ncbi:tellurite resistance/C4-dicarboxylate transporter family protein [Streptomyces sp. NPDC001941]|uniref:tellurite resistance/C4-dicarboxylate transporter family protein n=1 Tax=Streptomyces sp. NPDC001941 TaxID=3154659 RepID=UPI003329C616
MSQTTPGTRPSRPRPWDGVRQWWSGLTPVSGSLVMATGICSIGLHAVGHETLSRFALGLAGLAWLLLAVLFLRRFLLERGRWRHDADTPASLTAIAATCVLGSRLSLQSWQFPAAVLLVTAAVLWPVLLVAVVKHWGRHMPGAVFLSCVATQALVVLGSLLAAATRTTWLTWPALVLWGTGLVLYLAALPRFDLRYPFTGAGDQWIAGGAPAVSALAAAQLAAAPGTVGSLRVVPLAGGVLLGVAAAWYLFMVAAEILRPRPRYHTRRWATVFPMGMTAVATLNLARPLRAPWLQDAGRVLLWLAIAAWLLVFAQLIHHWTARDCVPTPPQRASGC